MATDLGMGGSQYPIEIKRKDTKEITLKWIAAKKQECKSRIAANKQAIDDLINGKVYELEANILRAQQELEQLEQHEKLISSSIDVDAQ